VEPGVIENVACVSAYCDTPKEAGWRTEVIGQAGVLSEVIDIEDVVQIDCPVVYKVTAKNQGQVPNTNVKFEATLDEGMEFVEAAGPTKVRANGNKLIFDALPSLAGNQQAVWKIVVKSSTPGDKRFVTELMTDQLKSGSGRPVVNAESTTIYDPRN